MRKLGFIQKLFARDETQGATPYTELGGFDFQTENDTVNVPYRIKFSKSYTPTDTVEHYCRRSRSSDGYKREAALKELITKDLDSNAAAYVLVALGDYVIEVSSLSLQATEKTKNELYKLVKDNPRLVEYLDAITVSYWNEYYRGNYPHYTDYPPYKFLQTLKVASR